MFVRALLLTLIISIPRRKCQGCLPIEFTLGVRYEPSGFKWDSEIAQSSKRWICNHENMVRIQALPPQFKYELFTYILPPTAPTSLGLRRSVR